MAKGKQGLEHIVLSLEDISKEVIPEQGNGRKIKICQVERGEIFFFKIFMRHPQREAET